ncbi:Alpha/Beta hydrolase protein [Aspergillus coremiiformis]|uniref:Kynurenine formamidase n=1 Tax=Aspergillus coremiiformis TaxID=138285 RepID=A0A5N6Z6I1_9EURO|nr:Alpha/Beta hydrolase protein [Aspergillus coremiiformis]
MPTETFTYSSDHNLQTVTVTTLSEPPPKGYWLILIHGGAWHDPDITSLNFANAAESLLTTSPTYTSTQRHIAAFASISYRLSPHLHHPQDRTSTNPREYRGATHPDHINDVQTAIAFLQGKYGFGERYILVGHSCGGTLAFQSVMGRFNAGVAHGPVAVVGVAGIYDLRLLRDTFKGIPAYQEIVEGAFGADETVWDAVSPAVVPGEDGVEGGWKAGRLAVLAYSSGDSLVDAKQWEGMRAALLDGWVKCQDVKRSVEALSLKGEHDECWQKGEELARAIAFTIEKLQKETSA